MQMNLREFTEAVDRETKEMSREELWLLVHSLVRKMPEEAREEFLDLIGRAREKETEDGESTSEIDVLAREREKKDIHELLTRLEDQFHEIEEGTLTLQADGHEDYSSRYWDADWVYEYEDPEGIGEIFEQADNLIQHCVNDGFYEEAVKLLDLAVGTEVYADDGGDGIFLGLKDLVQEQLASVDCERLIVHGLYAVYQNTAPDQRAQELYKYLNSYFFRGTRLEAFRSDTTAVNYLRIAAECEEPELYRKELMQAIHSCQAFPNDSENSDYGNRFESYRETSRNSMGDRERFLLCFLSGDFDVAMEKCAKVKEGLGWTGHVIKCGIPLFLLLLLQNGTLLAGCREQLKTVAFEMGFQKENYEKGLYKGSGLQEKSVGDEVDILADAFSKWKARQAVSEDQAEKYLVQLNRLIHMRVKAIVSGQHRRHYGSVAALAAALGEVRESRGELSAKDQILLNYKAEFPRHSSFHAELRAYGMPDTRKR